MVLNGGFCPSGSSTTSSSCFSVSSCNRFIIVFRLIAVSSPRGERESMPERDNWISTKSKWTEKVCEGAMLRLDTTTYKAPQSSSIFTHLLSPVMMLLLSFSQIFFRRRREWSSFFSASFFLYPHFSRRKAVEAK